MLHIFFPASHLVLYMTTWANKKAEKINKSKYFGKKNENLAKKGQKRENLKCKPCFYLILAPSLSPFGCLFSNW